MLSDYFRVYPCIISSNQAEKAKDKEENEEFTEQLDKNFASLVQSEALLSLTQPNKMKALKALVGSNITNDNAKKEVIHSAENKVSLPQVASILLNCYAFLAYLSLYYSSNYLYLWWLILAIFQKDKILHILLLSFHIGSMNFDSLW